MHAQDNYHYLFKYIIVGDSTGVGKSSLLVQYTDSKFNEEMDATIGVEFGCQNVKISDLDIKLQIWDTAGQESFKSITRSYYRGSIGGVLVYDITRRITFDNIRKWLKEIRDYACSQIELILVGNKTDLNHLFINYQFIVSRREVETSEGQNLADELKIEFYETSAKTGKNADVIFKRIAENVLQKIESKQINLQEQVYGIKVNVNNLIKKRPKQAIPYYELTNNGKIQNQEQSKQKDSQCC